MDAQPGWSSLLLKIILLCLFCAGGFLCAMNFYLSFLRYPLYRLRGRKAEYRHVSGAPLLGSFLVVVLLIPLDLPAWARYVGIALAALDTGGLHWFIGTMVWRSLKKDKYIAK